MKKYCYLPIFLLSLFFLDKQDVFASLKIVATTTTYKSLIEYLGKDLVTVDAVASPKFNLHFIQPKPSDVRRVSKADLFVFTGLDIEEWVGPLLEAAGRPELFRGQPRCLDLSKGIPLLNVPATAVDRSQGDIHLYGNPHVWTSPENIKIMAGSIRDKLMELDAPHASDYKKNAEEFLSKLDGKIAEWKQDAAHCKGQEIISYHDDLAYLTQFLGLSLNEFVEPKPGFPPTAKHLAHLEEYIQSHHIQVIAKPTFYPQGDAEKLAKKLGIRMVTVCQEVGELPELKDVFDFLEYNVKTLSDALK